ncbi:unnamed protein product [Meloidogyne enterolobii]|uniref:Uncharacterized protein n=2 Tax=Meloidogyne enterolobii TaxID=390850 RepID=A0ACB0ZS79_MELEN
MVYPNHFQFLLRVLWRFELVTIWLLIFGVALLLAAVCCKKKKKKAKRVRRTHPSLHAKQPSYSGHHGATLRDSKGYERVDAPQGVSKEWTFPSKEGSKTTTKQSLAAISTQKTSSGFLMRTGRPLFSAITTLTALSASRDPDKEFLGDSTLSEVIGYKMPDVDLIKQYYEYMKKSELKDEQMEEEEEVLVVED